MRTEETIKKIEKLKAGERYNFTLLYTGQRINNKFRFESPTGIHYILGLGDIEAVSPVSAPKYDPCRRFKKGDKVRVVENNGRTPTISSVIENLYEKTFTVIESEDRDNDTLVSTSKGNRFIPFYFLELVTPVEELEPYSIDPKNSNVLFKHGKKIATFEDDDEAQELCDRLNAEHRKAQNHD